MKELAKAYNPKDVEDKIYKMWEESGYFSPEGKEDKKTFFAKASKVRPFVIAIPPPNVTGELHMGHALNNTLQDVLIRKKRMEGVPTLWVPGTDHAGIATEFKVEQKLLKEEKIGKQDLGREKFIEKVWEWKDHFESTILGQLKKLGCSCDWSRTRFTMDEGYSKAVLSSFKNYWDKGYIYQGERIVNWCPRCHTTLSDLELEYKEEKGKLWFIRYPLAVKSDANPEREDYIVVATTRPETMLGDTAVAVNPSDERYKELVGKKVIVPLVDREVPIIADEAVEKEFGAGALKVTPGSDITDWEIGQRHSLEIIKAIDEDGLITDVGGPYCGMDRIKARERILEDLGKIGLLVKEEELIHNVSNCYRCATNIEPLVSKQWFVKMDKLVKPAIEVVEEREVKFIPDRWSKVYLDWMGNIRDWCISRQIWWGHRIPVWYKEDEIKVSLESPGEGWVQDEDVLDTWFSSALWPFATLGWPEETDDLKYFYPNSMSVTARDIINLWEARMIYSGIEFMNKPPFGEILINPTIFNKEGKRMSKSLGTGVDPLELIEKYGSDATRFGLLYLNTGTQDIKFSEETIQMAKTFMNKIWNAARFVQMKLGDYEQKGELVFTENTDADREIKGKLEEVKRNYNENLEKYRFGQAAEGIYHFFWHEFCDKYIEKAKEQIPYPLPENPDEKLIKETKDNLLYILKESLVMLHPMVPFITEEIYQSLPIDGKKEFLMIEKWGG
uniref:Valine--tRNA ligase n=1 Tax=candidate division CPR3 bacterium TaxID=2268181 RepID=A0A7C4M1W9_UNCC3